MENRNIIFTGPGAAAVVVRPIPELKEGQVLVRLVRSCISSGTERANLTGVPDNGVSIASSAPDGQVTWPRQCGYSSSGVVEAVGAGVSTVATGDRVALSWSKHAALVTIPANNVYRLPDGVSFEQAAWTHISTFPMAALRKCRVEIGEAALVMGQGVLGQLAVMLLRAAGAVPVIAADPIPERRARAIALGADLALDPRAKDFDAQVKAATRNPAASDRPDQSGARVVVEVTGCGAALDTALNAVAPFARVALLGCTRDSNFTVDYYHKVHGRGVTLVGAHTLARPKVETAAGWWTTRDDAEAFLKLVAAGRLDLAGFTEETHAVADAPQVFARLAKGGVFPNVQFDWTV